MSEALKRAKVRLLLNHPFFATLLLKMGTVLTENVPTAGVDGKNLYVNQKWFEGLDEGEREALLAHEVLHPAFLHHTRRSHRDPFLWNVACDYAINPILKDAGMRLPEGGCIDDKYRDMTADEIYRDLEKNAVKVKIQMGVGGGKGQGEGWEPGDGFKGGMGDVMDFPDLKEGSSATQHEEQVQIQNVIAAHTAAKQAGRGSMAIERMIQGLLEPKVDWRTELQRIVSEKTYNDYTWQKPNRRHLIRGFYLPILEDETYGTIALAIDTSGSIGQQQLNVFASECNGIGGIAKGEKWAIYCDDEVTATDRFEPDEELELRLVGGGGTMFNPPFEWCEDNQVEPKILIYFTDGYAYDFADEPDYPVIWCLYDGHTKDTFKPPYGDIIEIPKGME